MHTNKVSLFLARVRSIPVEYPLVRGMISYAIIWPASSIVQEYLANGTTLEEANTARAARFGIFGTFFMAPVFYHWMKFSNKFFIGKSLRMAATRAIVEQVTYAPIALAYFFFGMSLLEMKPVTSCVNEVQEKFWPTYKTGLMFWPAAQTINFHYVKDTNRILFVSVAGFVWTVYLAHMLSKRAQAQEMLKVTPKPEVEEIAKLEPPSKVKTKPRKLFYRHGPES